MTTPLACSQDTPRGKFEPPSENSHQLGVASDQSLSLGGVSDREAIKIAKEFLQKNGRLYSKYEMNIGESPENEWEITFQALPFTPGAHVTVVVGKDGSVRDLSEGL